MNAHVIVGAFLSSVLSGFLPLVNSEAVAVAAALLVTREAYVPLLVACVGGRMLAKGCLYGLARWSPQRLPLRTRTALAQAGERWKGRRGAGSLVMVSAAVGVPPFYVIALAAGALRQPIGLFMAAGTVGTAARYGALVWGAIRLTH